MKRDRTGWSTTLVFLCVALSNQAGFALQEIVDNNNGRPDIVAKKSEQSPPPSTADSGSLDSDRQKPGSPFPPEKSRSYEEFAVDMANSRVDFERAKSDFVRLEQSWKNKLIADEDYEQAKQDWQSAISKYQKQEARYRDTVRDVLARVKQARAGVDSAKLWLDKVDAMDGRASVPKKTVDRAKLRLDEATLEFDRIRSRYEVLQSAGQWWPEGEVLEDLISGVKYFEVLNLGMRIEAAPIKDLGPLAKTKYRGGMRILNVVPGSPAAKNGLQKDDILVGFDKWETTSVDNIAWIVGQLCANAEKARAKDGFKFFIIRGNETKYGFLPLPQDDIARMLED